MESIGSKIMKNLCLLLLLVSILLTSYGSSADKDGQVNEINTDMKYTDDLKDDQKELDTEVCNTDTDSDCSSDQKPILSGEKTTEFMLNNEDVESKAIDIPINENNDENIDSNSQAHVFDKTNDDNEVLDNISQDKEKGAEELKIADDASIEKAVLVDNSEEASSNTEEITESVDSEILNQNNTTSNSTYLYEWFKYFMDSFLEEFKESSTVKQPEEKENATTNSSDVPVESVFNESLTLNVSIVSPPKQVDISNDTQTAIQNTSETGKKMKFECVGRNTTDNVNSTVKIITSAKLLQMLSFDKNDTENITDCIVVMFYAPWCTFCAKTAPHFNALARAFPQLDFLAVDTAQFSNILARFGTVSVPNVLVFHQSRSTVKFNQTERVFENFVSFLQNTTGLEPNSSVIVTDEDFIGPVPSVPTDDPDYLLLLSWIFVIFCSMCMFIKSTKGQQWITRIRVLWQEHQHID